MDMRVRRGGWASAYRPLRLQYIKYYCNVHQAALQPVLAGFIGLFLSFFRSCFFFSRWQTWCLG